VATIRPFSGIHYARRPDLPLSDLIAPPYDVLDDAGKAALQAKHPNNIVAIDLPHMPPKSVGPDASYAKADVTFRSWMDAGILVQDGRPAMYPYSQSYAHAGRTFHRRGFIALVKLSPFGAGHVVPHEKTYKGPIEDRLKLMRSTGMQLSPVFGLFSDPSNKVTSLLYKNVAMPEATATMDGVKNDLWSVIDAEVEQQVIDAMGDKAIYIADGHHRYTTALHYLHEMEQQHGGPLPVAHPANYCMFVLISMQDDGLQILPTHRMLGGIKNFDIDKLRAAAGNSLEITESPVAETDLGDLALTIAADEAPTFALFDGKSRRTYILRLKVHDVLANIQPDQSEAWRKLDVAILQHYLIEKLIQPNFAEQEVTRGYTADASSIAKQVDGTTYQVALLLRPTALRALKELGDQGEVMPHKSTYFFPKLATGMMINPLR